MSNRADLQNVLSGKSKTNSLQTQYSEKIAEVKSQELVKNATTLGQKAGDTVAGFKNLSTEIDTANTYEEKGQAIVQVTENVDKLVGDGKELFDRTKTEINASAPSVSGLFAGADEEGNYPEGSIMNLLGAGGDGVTGDSAALFDAMNAEGAIEAVGGDIAGKIASIITLLTGLGAILDGLSAEGLSGSGLDSLSKTGQDMASKADGLMGSIENAAGTLGSLSDVQNISELTGKINDFASDITDVASQVSAIQDINPVSEFTGNLLQDDAGNLTELGQKYDDVSSTIKEVKSEVKDVYGTVEQGYNDINAVVKDVKSEVSNAQEFVGKVKTDLGSLQDAGEAATGKAQNTIANIAGAGGLAGTGITAPQGGGGAGGGGGGGGGGFSSNQMGEIISQAQSATPLELAKAAQTVGGGQVGIDSDIKVILKAQTGFPDSRNLVEKTAEQAKLKGISDKKISEFKTIMGVVETGLGTIDTTTSSLFREKDRSNIWDKSFDITSYPQNFDVFSQFETGTITADMQSREEDRQKKPVVFQTCDTKEELQTEVRIFKRPIKYCIIHATESFKNQNLTALEIHDDHKERGFDTIQFHMIIRRDGTMQRGLPTTLASKADPKEYRNEAVNIAMVGGIDAPTGTPNANSFRSGNSFTLAQYKTLDVFLDTFFKQYPGAEVYGYGELDEAAGDPYFDVEGYVRRKFQKVRA